MVFTGEKWIGVLLQVLITMGLGAGAWAVARSVISRIVGRVSNGYAMLKKPLTSTGDLLVRHVYTP